MSAIYRPQKKRSPGRSGLFYATIIIVIIFAVDLLVGGKIRAVARLGGSYVWQGTNTIGTSIAESGIFATRHQLAQDNADLRERLSKYEILDMTYVAMREENAHLKELVQFASEKTGATVPVISSASASPYGTFLIRAGINEGIARESVVYTADGFALGSVQESDAHTALVGEYFAPNAKMDAIIGDTDLTLEGSGGGNAFGKAPRDASIAVGDIAVSKQVGAPIGIVGKVVSDPSSSFTAVYVRFPTNLFTLRFVYVERN
jgi:cell shape-determining protein MreC